MTKKQKGKEPENIDYIKLKEIEDIIKADVKKDIKAWVWKPIAVLLIILGFFGYTGYEGLRKYES